MNLLDGSDCLLLDDYIRMSSLSKVMLRYGLGGGKRWLSEIAEYNPALMHAHFFNDGILARSWLFVAPSITAQSGDAEGLGMVFLEAQALQTPVVSFRSGGLVEAVEEGVTALLSEEKDVDGLSENIASLLENSSLRHHMGEAGRERVEQHFDLRKQCAKLESIYAKLS